MQMLLRSRHIKPLRGVTHRATAYVVRKCRAGRWHQAATIRLGSDDFGHRRFSRQLSDVKSVNALRHNLNREEMIYINLTWVRFDLRPNWPVFVRQS